MKLLAPLAAVAVLAGIAQAQTTKTPTEVPPGTKVADRISKMHMLAAELADTRTNTTKTDRLRIATFNAGLLSNMLVEVPKYPLRARLVPWRLEQFLRRHRPTAICLQELWYKKDRSHVNGAAYAAGYIPLLRADTGGAHGLQILVDRHAIKGKPGAAKTFRLKREFFFLVHRVLLLTRFELKSGLRVVVANTHLTFGFGDKGNKARAKQVRRIAGYLKEAQAHADVVALAGDFNLSAEFSDALPEEQAGWERNKLGYVDLVDRTRELRLLDTFRLINPKAPGWTQDRKRSDLTKASSTTKTEPEQRLDMVWIGSATRGFQIESSRLIFDRPLKMSGKPVEFPDLGVLTLSDHFGVMSTVEVFAPKTPTPSAATAQAGALGLTQALTEVSDGAKAWDAWRKPPTGPRGRP